MSPVIHAQIGWLLAQPFARRRDRVWLTALSLAPDLDGLGLIVSDDLYVAWHHRLTHGLIAACALPLLAWVGTRSWRVAAMTLVAFHVHLLADLAGSGPGWPIFYLWPWSEVGYLPTWQWDLASWPNAVIGLAITFASLSAAWWAGRTPVEVLSVRADRRVVEALRRRIGGGSTSAPAG